MVPTSKKVRLRSRNFLDFSNKSSKPYINHWHFINLSSTGKKTNDLHGRMQGCPSSVRVPPFYLSRILSSSQNQPSALVPQMRTFSNIQTMGTGICRSHSGFSPPPCPTFVTRNKWILVADAFFINTHWSTTIVTHAGYETSP